LGPLKLIGPFAHATSAMDAAAARQVALRVFAISTVCVVLAGFVGAFVLSKWHVSLAALTLAGGIIFLLVALLQLLREYEAPPPSLQSPATPMTTVLRLTFPVAVPPYGLAGVIALFAAAAQSTRIELIVALLVLVMVLNLLGMLYARRILSGPAVLVLQVVGAVLGVLQVALAVQIIVRGLRELGPIFQ